MRTSHHTNPVSTAQIVEKCVSQHVKGSLVATGQLWNSTETMFMCKKRLHNCRGLCQIKHYSRNLKNINTRCHVLSLSPSLWEVTWNEQGRVRSRNDEWFYQAAPSKREDYASLTWSREKEVLDDPNSSRTFHHHQPCTLAQLKVRPPLTVT